MHTLRTCFKNEIIAEFLVPRRKSNKVIIFCPGMPGVPGQKTLLEFFSKKGYWVFFPRYRGTWESRGKFLEKSPERDIIDIIDKLPRGFQDLWSKKRYKIIPQRLYIIGGSFGGPAAIFASRDPRVTKVVAISPVIDWRIKSKTEPLDWFEKFMRSAFGEGYRFSHTDWNKLKTGRFYNPMMHVSEFDGTKIYIFHARDDRVVSVGPARQFAKVTGATFFVLKKGGHFGLSSAMQLQFYRRIKRFFDTK